MSRFDELRQRAIDLAPGKLRSFERYTDALIEVCRQQIAEAMDNHSGGARHLAAVALDVPDQAKASPGPCFECGGAKFVCDQSLSLQRHFVDNDYVQGCPEISCNRRRRPCPVCTPKAEEKPSKFRGNARNYVALEHCGCNPSCSSTPGECVCPCEGCRSACAPKPTMVDILAEIAKHDIEGDDGPVGTIRRMAEAADRYKRHSDESQRALIAVINELDGHKFEWGSVVAHFVRRISEEIDPLKRENRKLKAEIESLKAGT
jgi:hypothetical protein